METKNNLYKTTKAWKEAEKALQEQNKINKDMFIKLKEWLEKQNEGDVEIVKFIIDSTVFWNVYNKPYFNFGY